MTISGDPNPSANNSSEDDTYMPSFWARPHGKGLANASGSGATRDEEEIEDEEDGGNENVGLRVMMMMRRRMKKFLMLRRSELQFFSYASTRIGGRKSATRAKQIW
jgi:hypothetical protein